MPFTKSDLEAKTYYSLVAVDGKDIGAIDQTVFDMFFEMTDEETRNNRTDRFCYLKGDPSKRAEVNTVIPAKCIRKLIDLQSRGEYSKDEEELLQIGDSPDDLMGVASRAIARKFDLPRII